MSQWHKYAVEWLEGRVTFYMDDEAFFVISNRTTPFRQNKNLLLDLQTDKFKANYKTSPPDTTYNGILGYFDVNYFRYHQLKYDCGTPVVEILNYDNPQLPNYYNYAVKKSISLSGVSSLTSGQNVSLRATDFIELKAGFEAPLGAELYLDINSCE